MRKTKIATSLVVMAVAILLAGNSDLYAGGGTTPWPIPSPVPSGTTWTGTLIITGQIQDVPGLPGCQIPNPTPPPALLLLPCGLPADATPAAPSDFKDQIVKIEFFVRLETKKQFATFSGGAIDNDGYYLFYAVGDFFNGRIGEALGRFLNEKVAPNLPGGPYAHAVLAASPTDGQTNVDRQLAVGGPGLQVGTPLYLNTKITVVLY